MTIAEIQNNAKTKMEKTKDVLRSDLIAIRAGRANPQLLDRITVDYYGTPTPLKNVANISAPEPRILQINPWDSKMVKDISKAIQASDLGLTPSNDGKVIRLMLPELTEERRKELTKLVRKTSEESKVAIRSIRRDAVDQVKKLKKTRRRRKRTFRSSPMQRLRILTRLTPIRKRRSWKSNENAAAWA